MVSVCRLHYLMKEIHQPCSGMNNFKSLKRPVFRLEWFWQWDTAQYLASSTKPFSSRHFTHITHTLFVKLNICMRRENKLCTQALASVCKILDRNEFSVTRCFQDEVYFYVQMGNEGHRSLFSRLIWKL